MNRTMSLSPLQQGIRFAMTGIKGVGEGVVEAIIEERKRGGPFTSLADFFKRIDTKKVGKKAVENLIDAGCFDFTGWSRAALLVSVDPLFAKSARDQKEAERGVLSLFSLAPEKESDAPPEIEEKEDKQKIMRREKELLGFYLTGHPMDEYRDLMQRLSCVPLSHFTTLDKGAVVRCAFIIETITVKIGQKNQRKFAILNISDGAERFELPVWSDLYEEKQHLLIENQLIYAVLIVDREDEETIRLQCRWLDDLSSVNDDLIRACDVAYDKAKMQVKMSEMRKSSEKSSSSAQKSEKEPPKTMRLRIDAEAVRFSHILELKKLFREHSGPSAVKLEFFNQEGTVGGVEIDGSWGVELSSKLEEKIKSISSVALFH